MESQQVLDASSRESVSVSMEVWPPPMTLLPTQGRKRRHSQSAPRPGPHFVMYQDDPLPKQTLIFFNEEHYIRNAQVSV
jgi:hypothetical protein